MKRMAHLFGKDVGEEVEKMTKKHHLASTFKCLSVNQFCIDNLIDLHLMCYFNKYTVSEKSNPLCTFL